LDIKKIKYLTKKNKNIISLIIYFLLLLSIEPLKSNCNSTDCKKDYNFSKKLKIDFEEKINKVNKVNNFNYLSQENIKSHNVNSFGLKPREFYEIYILFSRLLIANEQNKNTRQIEYSYEIESDKQYLIDNVYYAEGNVIVNLINGELKAEKIIFDKKNKILKAFNNVIFKKGNQYFKADYVEYDLIKSKGFIDNVFGIIDSKNLKKDFNFKNNLFSKSNDSLDDEINLVNNPQELGLLNSNNKRLKNIISKKNISFNFSSIKNWKFRSKKIVLEKDKWSSKMIEFSNDPFKASQLIIKSKDFYGEIIDDNIKLTSTSTTVQFDGKLSLPLGKRVITTDEKEDLFLKWGIAYSDDDRDGVFLIRNYRSIKLNDYFLLNLKPYFLVQRALLGESDAFRERDSSKTSSNVNKRIYFADYFALNTKLKGNISKWKLNIDSDLKTLNPSNFYDAFSLELNLLRNLFNRSKPVIGNSESNYNDSKKINYIEKNKVDFGVYKIIDKGGIYRAIGSKLITKYSNKKKNLKKDYSIILDIGNFEGKNSINQLETLNLLRYGTNISLMHTIRILNLNAENQIYNSDFRYTSKFINKGLFLRKKFAFGLYEYSDNNSQRIFSTELGPTFIIGDLKKHFFDYSEISIFSEFVSKRGESPFSFDNFNNDSRVNISLRQQILGPLIIGYKTQLNINNESVNYGNFETQKISLELSRRAYSFALSYDAKAKNIFLGFDIFNFGNRNFEKRFQ
tara:strand:+ start:2735 stop:4948 length:2214 start_codon:yes stop_codon:yes gene_type:complete